MKRTIFIIFVLNMLLVSASAVELSAQSAILYQPQTKTVLFEKNADEKRAIASTTKIMTAVVVLENARTDEIVTISPECVGIEGTSVYLKEGEKISVSDLLYGLMLSSGNDAALALAHHVGDGSVSAFVDMMNKTAKRLGMNNSSFKNPNGLPADEHFSTARDMARLATYAMSLPEFKKIVATTEKNAGKRQFVNHNKLLRLYEGANGIKTGFTKAAGRCLVSCAERENMSLIAVTLSAPDDWDDHIKLFDFGFSGFSVLTMASPGKAFAEVPVVGGMFNSTPAVISREVRLLEDKRGQEKIETEIFLPRFLYAGVSRGDVIGHVEYRLDGRLLDSAFLLSGKTVAAANKKSSFENLLDFLKGA